MEPEVVNKLLQLNQDFYATYAQSFSNTRYSVQPGVQRLLPQLMQAELVVDLGCGNGNLAQLVRKQGFCGSYLGVDENEYFLEQAELAAREASCGSYAFRSGSLADSSWLGLFEHADAICSFASLHHLPGADLHRQFFASVNARLSPGGLFYLSCWQVLGSARLEKHIVSWKTHGIPPEQLSETDLLLDWRADPDKPAKLRYVHHFSPSELQALGNSQGLHLVDEFFSDGKEGDLGLYQVWQKPEA